MPRRGSGTFQARLQRELSAVTLPISLVELRWRMWDRNHPTAAALPKPFHQQLRRSLERSKYTVNAARLRDFGEVISVYPYKTLSRGVRLMRERLLPHLKPLAERNVRYSRAENERHLLARDREFAGERYSQWMSIEVAIYTAMKSHEDFAWAVPLLCRGRELLAATSVVSCARDLGHVVAATGSHLGIEHPLTQRLRGFLEELLPLETRRATRLRSQLHGLADLFGHGPASLKTTTAEWLLEQAPAFVKSLPGHKDRQAGMYGMLNGTRFRPELDRLLGRDALQEFEFVTGRSAS